MPPVSLNPVIELSQFRGIDAGLTADQKQTTLQQALILFDELYAHLPLKQAMYGLDPVQRIKLLTVRLTELTTEGQFHNEMLSIFNGVRDLHTNYLLPEPFSGSTAFLPFMVDEYFDQAGNPHYPVTYVQPGLGLPAFAPGVEILYWNGSPMSLTVERNAEINPGANADGRHIQGLRNMTVRPLISSLPPIEDWVIVTYVDAAGAVAEARFPWRVFRNIPKPNAVNTQDSKAVGAATMGLDLIQELTHQARKWLFSPQQIQREQLMMWAMSGAAPAAAPQPGAPVNDDPKQNFTTFPDELLWGKLTTLSGVFGYLRIRSFNVADVPAFLMEVIRILSLVPQQGLILDVRSNPGGNILAGEYMLQLFSDRPIEPEPVYFRNTVYTMGFAENQYLAQWSNSIKLSVLTASVYSQGFPLADPKDANAIGRRYPGKVVLLTDAACYSTTDFFCAGFQDHEIGRILGTDERTGAGGANVWTHALLSQFWPGDAATSPFKPLPNGMDMRIAFRRSTRVGKRNGIPLEDLGMRLDPAAGDRLHRRTRRDIFENDIDLFNEAGAMLAQMIIGQ